LNYSNILDEIEDTYKNGGVIMITNVSLTTKEKNLLEDQKKDEELCIQKYSNYSNMASDTELKNLFQTNMKQEEQHLNTINSILTGQFSAMNSSGSQSGSGSQGSQGSQSSQSGSGSQSSSASQQNQSPGSFAAKNSFTASQNADKDLCSDILMTEKFVSSAYNTAIFEFRDPAIRDALNHIQKEEQKHGESVYKYMESKGMYNPQS
jgi:spore coat protein CotF